MKLVINRFVYLNFTVYVAYSSYLVTKLIIKLVSDLL
jgi:hypothetical protein